MADASGSIGTGLKTLAPAFSAIPGIGSIVGMGATLAGGVLEEQAAKKQAEQAAKIRRDALSTKKQALRPEFEKKKRLDEMLALEGVGGSDLLKGNIDEATANNLRNIRESSRNGTSTLNAINAAVSLGNGKSQEIDVLDAQAKQAGKKQVGNDLWSIGEQQRKIEDIRDAEKKDGLQAAAAMENAATADKLNATKGIIAGVSQGLNTQLNNAPAYGQIGVEQHNYKLGLIQDKLSNGGTLSKQEMDFLKKNGINIDDLMGGNSADSNSIDLGGDFSTGNTGIGKTLSPSIGGFGF